MGKFAFDHAEQAIRTYALDRIREAAFYRLEKFIEDYGFHPDRYFQHVIGVSVSAEREPEKVLLRANPERARYIATKPLHPTQQMVKQEEDGAVVFSLHLCHNMELENLLLSFGETVEVLQPNGLRQAIAERAAKLHRLYQ